VSSLPIGSGPLMGFALWHLQRGETLETVTALIAEKPEFGGIPQARIDEAIAAAQENLLTTELAAELKGSQNLGEATGQVIASDTVFGVRVQLTHVDQFGNLRIASVVLNATAGSTVQSILDAAEEYANSGALAQRTGHASPGTFGDPQIFQVVAGGLPGAVIGVL
jgi:hypothetical protein